MMYPIIGGVQALYLLEGLTDSGKGGNNLTNYAGGVIFTNQGRHEYCADFGTGGSGEGLVTTSNIFSSTTPDEVYFSFFIQLNSSANDATLRTCYDLRSVVTGTGRHYLGWYAIASSTVTFTSRRVTTGAAVDISVAFPADTSNWYFIQYRYSTTSSIQVLAVFDSKMKQINVTTSNTNTTGSYINNFPTYKATIGNNRALTTSQVKAKIDTFIMDDTTFFSLNVADDGGVAAAHQVRYRAQAIAMNVLI